MAADIPTDALVAQVEAHTGKKAVEWKRPDCGLTEAQHFVVKLEDGSGVFAKAAVDELTERWFRVDHLIMTTVERRKSRSVGRRGTRSNWRGH